MDTLMNHFLSRGSPLNPKLDTKTFLYGHHSSYNIYPFRILSFGSDIYICALITLCWAVGSFTWRASDLRSYDCTLTPDIPYIIPDNCYRRVHVFYNWILSHFCIWYRTGNQVYWSTLSSIVPCGMIYRLSKWGTRSVGLSTVIEYAEAATKYWQL